MIEQAVDHNVLRMARTREVLIRNPRHRQRAIAEFPLRVASMAADMKRLCDLRDSSPVVLPECDEAIEFIEGKIREQYRYLFGSELGR